MEPKRLNKYISDAGFCSRREADKLIEQGRVSINGKIPEAGAKVTSTDKVRIDDEILSVKIEESVFLAFNKPAGIATTTDLSVKNNLASALNYPAALLPVGHLDRDAEGLMFLTNDTELARKMTKADTKYEKDYLVTVDKMITPDFLSKISEGGAPVPGANYKKSFVSKEASNRFRIILESNTNHHIKRMVEFLGYQVVHLQRIRIQELNLSKLPVRFWRKLTEAEIESLKSIIAGKKVKGKFNSNKNAGTFTKGDFPDQINGATSKRSFTRATPTAARLSENTINPKSKSARKATNKPNNKKESASRGNTPKNTGRKNKG